MKFMNTMVAVTTLLMVSVTSAITLGEPEDNPPKVTPSAGSPFLKIGESFLVNRSRILKSGWRPTSMHLYDEYEIFGTEKILRDRNFPEVASCSMDAGVLCIFYYSKETKCLRVDTRGEQLKDMKVTRWTDECPEDSRSAKE